MKLAKSPVTPIQLGYEGTIVSTTQPRLLYEQGRAMIGNFGLRSTLQTLLYKRTGESDDIAFDVTADELEHPLYIRKTHSDLSNVVDVFCRRIYDVPTDLAHKIGSRAIVDIGAYNGTTPAYFANHYPDSEVLAVEPNPRNYPLLAKNISLYGDQITSLHAAATYTEGSVRKNQFGFATDSMQNAFVVNDVEAVTGPAIESITPTGILSHLDDEQIGILKVDIEGAEKPLFDSPLIDELLSRTGVLLIETHDQFMPGASEVVHNAATRNGLFPSSHNPHTEMYYRV
jgi:FkbM family methyltransferase